MIYKKKPPILQDLYFEKETIAKSSEQESKVFDGSYDLVSEKTYFAFIDVLGFKNDYYENMLKGHNSYKSFNKYSEVFKKFFDEIESKGICDGIRCYAGQTSDSLYFYTDREDFLIEFVEFFAYFNIYSILKGVFFRGGIACGNLFRNKPYQFYGNSVINAYKMESEIATNPLIIVDSSTYNVIKKDNNNYLFLEEIIGRGRYYLNPFAYFSKEWEFVHKEAEKFIPEKVIEQIEEKMKAYEYDNKIYNKFFTLKNIYEKEKNKFR